MRYTLITQIVLISVSLVIIFAFVKPIFAEIKTTQDEIFLYADAVKKASQFNAQLQSLISIRDAFSQNDRQALDTFIPTQIDSLKVMRDIESIFALRNKPLLSLTSTEVVYPNAELALESQIALPEFAVSNNTTYQDFYMTFVGSYTELKDILGMIETNETLLELVEVHFSKVGNAITDENEPEAMPDGMFQFSLTLRTFAVSSTPQ